MMVEGSPRIMAVATQGVQSGTSIGSPREQEDKKDREQGVNCLTPERPCFIPIKQDSTDVQLSRWKKLRTTVQLGSAVTQVHKRQCLKREDSFIKRFSARPPPIVPDVLSNPRRWKRCPTTTVMNPYESLLFWWLWILTGCVLYNAWTLIVRQAFPELQESLSALWHTADGCSDLVFLLDVVVQFRTGYLEQGIMVRDGVQLAKHYVTSKAFFLDVAALIPLDLAQMWIGPFPLLRLPRFLKVQRTYNFYYTVESRTAYPNLWRVVNLVHVLLLLAHWFGCFYYMLSELENFEGNWSYPRPEKEYSTLVRKYLGSVYWSTLTLTTIGDLATPATNLQYLFTIISYLIGVFIFATIVGQVGNVITNRNASRLEFERLLDGAKLYMRHHKVPREMQRRVQRWYDYSWSRGRMQGGGDIHSALGILPDKLKTELALHVNLKTLKKVTIFQECQPEFLYDLVLKMKAYIFTPGDLICRKGEVAREMFIIADGILEVINENGLILTQMKAGDFFGEIGILNLDGFNRRTADVRSVGYSELFSLSREDVLMAMKDYPDAQEILHSMGRKRLMEARVKSPGKEEDGGKKNEKPSSRLLGSRNAKSIADHNKISGEHSVLKKVKENFFPTQQKSATVEKSEATRSACAELCRDSSPKKWSHSHSGANFPTNEKRLHSSLNVSSSQSSVISHDLVPSVNSVASSTNILFKSRRTSVEQSKSKSPQLSSMNPKPATLQDTDCKDKISNNYLQVTKKPNTWRRFSDVVSVFARDKEDFRKDSLQNTNKNSKPAPFNSCFSASQDAKLYANDPTIGVKAWQHIQSNIGNSSDGDKVSLVNFDCTTAELDYKPMPVKLEIEIQQSCDDGELTNNSEVSRATQVSPSVLSGKVVSANRRSKKSSQRTAAKRHRHRNRKKSSKATSPTEVKAENGKQICEFKSKLTDQKTETSDPIQLAILRYFHCDIVPADESESTQTEQDFIPEEIVRKIEELSSGGNINEFLAKVTDDIQLAVISYIMQKQGGLWLRIMELEDQIKERDEVITQLKTEAERLENEVKESTENDSQAASENPEHTVIDPDQHANDQIMPRISIPAPPERHVQFSQNIPQDDDASKPLPLPDIVEYMESSMEDPCDELEEDDLWRVEFPDNDVQVKIQGLWKRPKMRRHSSVEVGSETPMYFVSGNQRVEHLLPPHAEETNRMTARRYSESQTNFLFCVANEMGYDSNQRKWLYQVTHEITNPEKFKMLHQIVVPHFHTPRENRDAKYEPHLEKIRMIVLLTSEITLGSNILDFSEFVSKTEIGEPNPHSFAARVRKVFQKIKSNADVKVPTNPDSKDPSSILNLGRSSKRLSDGGVSLGSRQPTAWAEKPRRYSDTLLRSTNACSDSAATSGENGSAISNARRISSEGNLGRTGFRTLPTISEDDILKKLISSSLSFESTIEEGFQDSLSNNEAQVSCVVELPPEVIFQKTRSETSETSPCRQKR